MSTVAMMAYVQRMEKSLHDIDRWCDEFKRDKNKSNSRVESFVKGIKYLVKDGLGEGDGTVAGDRGPNIA